jgi:uncharacterized protein YgiM (DUF1202 family)
MKSISLQKSLTAALISVAALSVAVPSYAQAAIAPELAEKAKKACIDKAQAKGYTLKDVTSVEPYDATGDRVKVVLNLTKNADGTEARLTCGYSDKDGAAAFDGDTTTAQRQGFPWWWLLLPILGIPLLFALLRGKERPVETTANVYNTATTTAREAVVRANGEYLDIHSGPGTAYQVTGTLRNGQRVMLSSRRDNNWVELETGGWVPVEYLDLDTSYRQA